MRLILNVLVVGLCGAVGPANGQTTIFVDDDAILDPGKGDPDVSDPLEDGSSERPFDAIQEAIDAASDGDTILLRVGLYSGVGNRDVVLADKSIALVGEDNEVRPVIDCGGTEQEPHIAFDMSMSGGTLSFENLTIRNAYVGLGGIGGFGGAMIRLSGEADLSLINCTLEDATSPFVSALRVVADGSLTMTDCVVTGMLTTNDDPGIACWTNGVELSITRSRFVDNAGTGLQAEIVTTAEIVMSEFVRNRWSFGAHGLFLANCDDSVIRDCQFIDNGGSVGCTIEDMDGLLIDNCIFRNNQGGGLQLTRDCEVDIRSCKFLDNVSTQTTPGRGLTVGFGCEGTVWGCEFRGNATSNSGGGVRLDSRPENPSQLCFRSCDFVDNSAPDGGGGAIAMFRLRPEELGRIMEIDDCLFQDNSAVSGGAVLTGVMNDMPIARSRFIGNTADMFGGGVCTVAGQLDMVSCLFAQNKAPFGAAVCEENAVIRLNAVTMANHASPDGVIYLIGGILNLTNSIVDYAEAGAIAFHIDDDGNALPADVTIRNSIVRGGYTGPGTVAGLLDTDPIFRDAATADYRLAANSPAIDAGTNEYPTIDRVDMDGDGIRGEFAVSDLRKAPRYVDNPTIADSGFGFARIVDLGAYEYQAIAEQCEVCFVTLNGHSRCAVGACCFEDGDCRNSSARACTAAGGRFLGSGTTCTSNACAPGACCLDFNGVCTMTASSLECESQGRSFQGEGTSCEDDPCSGACCTPAGCFDLIESNCDFAGGVFMGIGTGCSDTECP